MKPSLLGGSVVAFTVASSASAAVFTGWTATSTTNSAGNIVWSVYANFDMAGHIFLNCFNHGGANQTSGSMGAMHNDLYSDPAGGVFGSWSPSAITSIRLLVGTTLAPAQQT